MGKRQVGGFTLIELMLVVAIIALLAAIAIPKFADMVIRAKEAGVKGKTGSFRSALTIYYSDTEGLLPNGGNNVRLSLVPKYISEIPSIAIPTVPGHRNSSLITMSPNAIDWAGLTAWRYTNSPRIAVNCTHPDSRGSSWSRF
jgi:prepilin-type N-terminal cleavage/methylation domain-containing protein